MLLDFYPTVGPLSGGTRLTLVGYHLNAGVQAALTLRDVDDSSLSVSCKFDEQRSFNTSVCVTSSAARPFHARSILLSIDNSSIPHSLPAHGFLVTTDPVVRTVTPDRSIMRRVCCCLLLDFREIIIDMMSRSHANIVLNYCALVI